MDVIYQLKQDSDVSACGKNTAIAWIREGDTK